MHGESFPVLHQSPCCRWCDVCVYLAVDEAPVVSLDRPDRNFPLGDDRGLGVARETAAPRALHERRRAPADELAQPLGCDGDAAAVASEDALRVSARRAQPGGRYSLLVVTRHNVTTTHLDRERAELPPRAELLAELLLVGLLRDLLELGVRRLALHGGTQRYRRT